jgi:hypothetical protein
MQKIDLDKLSRKERAEYIKKLRKEQQSKEKRFSLIFTIILVVGLLLAVIGLYLLTTAKPTTTNQSLGEFVAAPAPPNDRLHIAFGEKHVPYTSNPPSSGPHYSLEGLGPIACQVYDKEIKDESVVHNLEHGAVWITYKDINDHDLAQKLSAIAKNFSKVVLSPRAANDSRIALVSWERVLKLDKFDKTKIEDFIKLYRNSKLAPEPLASCGSMPTQ